MGGKDSTFVLTGGICILRSTKGSIALEAAVSLPFFLAFVIALNVMIQMSIMQLALHTAVTETTKQIASHAYPVELMYLQAEASPLGQTLQTAAGHVKTAREAVAHAEELFGDFTYLIPDEMLDFAVWLKNYRQTAEQTAGEKAKLMLAKAFQPMFIQLTKKILPATMKLDATKLSLKEVILPVPGSREHAFVGITAEYTYTLPVPFIHKTVTLREQSYERAWVGN
ncbi:hypothetical protein [Paenibacillus gansuensis]|uniref:Pilus assembly protein TadE n=1 Tax=Paenibacillus gansuensis TaxID=306542 RepID=A0ABW5PAF0_9BACL